MTGGGERLMSKSIVVGLKEREEQEKAGEELALHLQKQFDEENERILEARRKEGEKRVRIKKRANKPKDQPKSSGVKRKLVVDEASEKEKPKEIKTQSQASGSSQPKEIEVLKSKPENFVPIKAEGMKSTRGQRKRDVDLLHIEYGDGSKFSYTFRQVMQQGYETLRKIYTLLKRDYFLTKGLAQDITQRMKVMREGPVHEERDDRIKVWNPENKKVLHEPFYIMIYKDREGREKCIDICQEISKLPNLELNYLASQLGYKDEDEKILKGSLFRQMKENEDRMNESNKRRRR